MSAAVKILIRPQSQRDGLVATAFGGLCHRFGPRPCAEFPEQRFNMARAARCSLQQLSELLDTKSRLSHDRTKSTGLQIVSRVHRNRYGASRITWIHKDMMAADDSINDKTGSLEGANDRSAVHYRQSPARHNQLATVTRRISGCASAGIARP
jgi:hypothetical protein